MTPENDMTLRGIFRPNKRGFDQWNDVRDYEDAYGPTNVLVGRMSLPRMMQRHIDSIVKVYTILDERRDKRGDEDYHIALKMYSWFPYSTTLRDVMDAYWYGYSDDGTCDVCNKVMHMFNKTPHHMCVDCSRVHNQTIKMRYVF